MRRTASLLLAVSLVLAAGAEERPRYGGSLRVQLRESVVSLDPADGKDLTLARSRIAQLLFDRLTEVDDQGHARPQLAISWTTDASHKTWRFTLRPNVTFHDGTPLTNAQVIANFANDSRWQVRAGNGPLVVVFECPAPIYDLPAVLAGARHSIILRSAAGIQGTGPFKAIVWQPGRQLSLAANLDHYAGRPYIDGVEIMMGNSLREQMIDLRLDRDDLIEVDPDQARRLEGASQRVVSSAPARLLALVFPGGDARVRELLALSLDRNAIHAAILRKAGAPAAGLLPQWLSGYALLWEGAADTARLQKLRSQIGRTQPLYLAYDPADPLQKAVADRVAVNARDVGLMVNVYAERNASIAAGGRADIVLASLPLGSASAAQSLAQLAGTAQLEPAELLAASTPEQLYAAEDAALATYKLIPIAHLPHSVWLSSRVRNWKTTRDGRWNLDEVWLESNK